MHEFSNTVMISTEFSKEEQPQSVFTTSILDTSYNVGQNLKKPNFLNLKSIFQSGSS